MRILSKKSLGFLSICLLSFGLLVEPSKKAIANTTCLLSDDHCTTIRFIDPATGQFVDVKVKGTKAGPTA